jgi:hypothetical protein
MDPEGVTVSGVARMSKRERVGERKGKTEEGKGRNYRLTTISSDDEDDGVVMGIGMGREKGKRREKKGCGAH